jgi:hypothetical protein
MDSDKLFDTSTDEKFSSPVSRAHWKFPDIWEEKEVLLGT